MIISRLLAALAVLGMLLTPILHSAMAMPVDMMNMAGDESSMDMPMDMDMPCCSDQAPMSDCTNECPFVGLCMVSTVLNLPAGIRLFLAADAVNNMLPDNVPDFTSLNHDPPLRPPQT